MPLLTDITLGQYFAVDSFIHRLDPRTKIMATLIVMIALMAVHHWLGYAVFIAGLAIVIGVSKVPPAVILRNLRPFLWLFILTIGLHGFISQHEATWTIPYIGARISLAGLLDGLIYSLRLVSFIVVAALLTLTTSPIEITDALERMLTPLERFRFPVHELIMMMTLAMRFIPTLMGEADKLRKAQISRGVSFRGSLRQRVSHIIPLVIPLFISVFRRADELALAMDARCYSGGHGRTRYKELRMTMNDVWVLIGISFFVIVLGYFL